MSSGSSTTTAQSAAAIAVSRRAGSTVSNRAIASKEIHEVTGVTRGSVGKTLQRLEERQLVRHAEPYWAIGDDDRVGAYLGMLSSLESVAEREGTEDYAEWRDAANAER